MTATAAITLGVRPLPLHRTENALGEKNGSVTPLWNIRDEDAPMPRQVYVVRIKPGFEKGPHLHKRRDGQFVVVTGQVEFTVRTPDGTYRHFWLREVQPHMLTVPPAHAVLMRCVGHIEAVVLNMPTLHSWAADDQDEWPVEDWNP